MIGWLQHWWAAKDTGDRAFILIIGPFFAVVWIVALCLCIGIPVLMLHLMGVIQ